MMPSANNQNLRKMVHHHNDQAAGTVGGTLIALIGILDMGDILKTGILACVGAIVSFGVSKGLQKIWPGSEDSGE